VHHYLKQACTGWFKKTIKVPEAKEVASYFHMLCIAPRKLYSVSDALFCHSFTKLLQSFNTSNYPALLHYDLIFYEVVSVLDAGSLNEVYRFGIPFIPPLMASVTQLLKVTICVRCWTIWNRGTAIKAYMRRSTVRVGIRETEKSVILFSALITTDGRSD
jgi:hypothetical protein